VNSSFAPKLPRFPGEVSNVILESGKRFLIAINAGMAQVISPILPILYIKILRASVLRTNNNNRPKVSKKKFRQYVTARTRSNSNRTLREVFLTVIFHNKKGPKRQRIDDSQ